MTDQIGQHTLEVPGARLYYETQGTGRVLVLVPGANGEHNIFTPIRHYLSQHFKVVTYDRRGFSQSELIGAQDYEHRLETDADDVRRLMEHLSDQPGIVFGSSSGAIVSLMLLMKHPSSVHTLIAHEPPVVNLLPDSEKWREFFKGIYNTYKKSGPQEAMKVFVGNLVAGDDAKAMSEAGNRGEYATKNITYWFDHEVLQYPEIKIDFDILRAQSKKLILAGGVETKGQFPYFPITEMSKRLNKEILELPGGHLGYLFHAEEFSRVLLGGIKQRNAKL